MGSAAQYFEVEAPVEQVYAYWRDLSHFPAFRSTTPARSASTTAAAPPTGDPGLDWVAPPANRP
jgi:hypothetical protein